MVVTVIYLQCEHPGCAKRYTILSDHVMPTRAAAEADGWDCSRVPVNKVNFRSRDLCEEHRGDRL